MGIAFDITRKEYFTGNSFILQLSQSLLLSFNISRVLGPEVFDKYVQ